MSAKVVPLSVCGVATLSNIALRASTQVPPRHRPDGREQQAKRAARKAKVVEACRWLADSLGRDLQEMERRLDCLEAKRKAEAQGLSPDQSNPNRATCALE